MKPFTSDQLLYISKGEKESMMLEERVKHAYRLTPVASGMKRHYYITGGPGIGKSYIVDLVAEMNGIKLVKIHSTSSMNALTIQLAVAAFLSGGEDIFIWIDDCDSLFSSSEALSVMKGVLDEDRNILTWNKNLTSLIMTHEKNDTDNDRVIASALRHYQIVGGVGISIPTDNMHFIITSNHPLAASNPMPKQKNKINESAIRDRVRYKGYNLDWKTNWGWMAYIALKADLSSIDLEQKHILLDWMFNNWKRLPSYSMRTIGELAADMSTHPNDYPDYWETYLI